MRISDWSSDVCSSDLALARTQEQIFAVGRESDARAKLAARPVRARSPDHRHILERRVRRIGGDQRTPGERQRTPLFPAFGIGELERLAVGAIGRDRDIEPPAPPPWKNGRA